MAPLTDQTGPAPRRTILVVDDSAMNRALLADILEEDYDIVEACDGVEAVDVLAERSEDISLVILDIMMPRLDGFGVLKAMNEHGWIEHTPVVTISAEDSPGFVKRAYTEGVSDFIGRPFDELVVRHRVRNTIRLYQKQHDLLAMVTAQMYERERQSNLMVSVLAHIVEFHNGESGMHVIHIGVITNLLLTYLRSMTDAYDLTEADVASITMASALHDIGKITVPSEIINKPGRLTDEEFAVMKSHSAAGAAMLDDLPVTRQEEGILRDAHDICRWHHERWDGRGYPDGLKGDEIPISAQVVAMADVYDALTSKRVYKPAYSHEKTIEMITGGECGQFNPLLIECLLAAADEIRTEINAGALGSVTQSGIRSIVSQIEGFGGLSVADKETMKHDLEVWAHKDRRVADEAEEG